MAEKETPAYDTEALRLEVEQESCVRQPAVMVNRFIVSTYENHVRIAFMEIVQPYGNVRTAVAMDRKDAQALANLLTLLLAEGAKQ